MRLIAKATIQIQKPASEVFEGIVDHKKMTHYFISESTGRMEAGRELFWKFPEFPDEYPVWNIQTETDRLVEFAWDKETEVRIALEPQADGSTVVKVTEGDKGLSEQNLQWLTSNTEGWANFLACMKAYLEYGIELRKGAFDFMRK
ncbi:SRPBCC domain-containing protein [Algoriphagus aestuariicola]|uniref:SRPBCC domain-containing protein n=1 Tax=Algoriphagus aestuariicola TaxID=1852016 RepID=A0ABS3BJG0_9BACT|nr:SRPBCC domain-containing protein [Algoriphagus aestuariicola]MBN7799438.1 SRPBCC domain-containing protein [Algoriphagus aestuariicola]